MSAVFPFFVKKKTGECANISYNDHLDLDYKSNAYLTNTLSEIKHTEAKYSKKILAQKCVIYCDNGVNTTILLCLSKSPRDQN